MLWNWSQRIRFSLFGVGMMLAAQTRHPGQHCGVRLQNCPIAWQP